MGRDEIQALLKTPAWEAVIARAEAKKECWQTIYICNKRQYIHCSIVWFKLIDWTNSLWRVGLLQANIFRKLAPRLVISTAFRKGLELNGSRTGECVHHLKVVTRDLMKDKCKSNVKYTS